jgi:RNA polymerase sigma factor (sigma-70 family)
VSAPDREPATPVVGDEAELYRDLQPRLLGLLGSTVTARVQTLEDACSLAWVALIRTQPDRSSVFAWLYVTARHEALRLIAAERRTPTLEPAGDRHLLAFREPVPNATCERAREALHALAALPERQRRLLCLQAAGYSYTEIAAIEGISWRTVDRQLRRARAGLVVGEGGES